MWEGKLTEAGATTAFAIILIDDCPPPRGRGPRLTFSARPSHTELQYSIQQSKTMHRITRPCHAMVHWTALPYLHYPLGIYPIAAPAWLVARIPSPDQPTPGSTAWGCEKTSPFTSLLPCPPIQGAAESLPETQHHSLFGVNRVGPHYHNNFRVLRIKILYPPSLPHAYNDLYYP